MYSIGILSLQLYSKFTWYGMRFLPIKYSPTYDPVTLWKRSEVLERYRLRKEKNWREKKKRATQGHSLSYPWTAAHPVCGIESFADFINSCNGSDFNGKVEY